jgi:hypothetical protein
LEYHIRKKRFEFFVSCWISHKSPGTFADTKDYEVSWVEFKTEKHENFNWNRMDFYVCTRGDKEFVLTESLKYWRFRLYALPMNQFQQITKKILDGESKHGNIYR